MTFLGFSTMKTLLCIVFLATGLNALGHAAEPTDETLAKARTALENRRVEEGLILLIKVQKVTMATAEKLDIDRATALYAEIYKVVEDHFGAEDWRAQQTAIDREETIRLGKLAPEVQARVVEVRQAVRQLHAIPRRSQVGPAENAATVAATKTITDTMGIGSLDFVQCLLLKGEITRGVRDIEGPKQVSGTRLGEDYCESWIALAKSTERSLSRTECFRPQKKGGMCR